MLNCRNTLTRKQGRGISFQKLFSVILLVNTRSHSAFLTHHPALLQPLKAKGTSLALKRSQLSSAFKTIQHLTQNSER